MHEQLAKASTGIRGFDLSTNGGLPRGRTSLIVGGPGSGKTVFALQSLVNGARRWNEPGIFVAFEENSRQIIANAASFGWDLPALEKDNLFFLDARMSQLTITAGQFDLAGMLARLNAKVDEMHARRIVFDSMDVLLSLLDDRVSERQEIYRIHDWLQESKLTGIVTARTGMNYPAHLDRYGFMQFMADCVVVLSHQVEDRVSLRTVRTLKYRGSSFLENELPLVIGPTGLDVGIADQLEPRYEASGERVSTGVRGLDDMLSGGYYRGSSVLISGAPGTAKSTLCGAFVEAACQRGERALFVSFDESASEIIRNLASVAIHLQPHIDSGALRIYSIRSEAGSADLHLMRLRALFAQHRPACVAIDPLSAMARAGGGVAALSMAERLMSVAKSQGTTLLLTSLLAGDSPEVESTPLAVSTIADTWIHLSYRIGAGERNRALTIVKARGTPHSNQVRELVLDDTGISLSAVYTAGGEVLMGTLRWEKEREAEAAEARRQAELVRRQQELALAETEAQARIQVLRREIESIHAEAQHLQLDSEASQKRESDLLTGIRQRRQGTLDPADDAEETPPSTEHHGKRGGEVQ